MKFQATLSLDNEDEVRAALRTLAYFGAAFDAAFPTNALIAVLDGRAPTQPGTAAAAYWDEGVSLPSGPEPEPILAGDADEDAPERELVTAEQPKRRRRTKAEMEAARAAEQAAARETLPPAVQEAIAEPVPEPDDLLSAILAEPEPEPEPEPVDRDALLEQVRTRARSGVDQASKAAARKWLLESVFRGKSTPLSDVPTDVLVRALAEPLPVVA